MYEILYNIYRAILINCLIYEALTFSPIGKRLMDYLVARKYTDMIVDNELVWKTYTRFDFMWTDFSRALLINKRLISDMELTTLRVSIATIRYMVRRMNWSGKGK